MEDVRKGKRNGRSHIGICVSVCNCCFCVLVSKHVQSPSELLSAEQWQEGLGRPNTTYSRLMRFYLKGFLKKGWTRPNMRKCRRVELREGRTIKVTRNEREERCQKECYAERIYERR